MLSPPFIELFVAGVLVLGLRVRKGGGAGAARDTELETKG